MSRSGVDAPGLSGIRILELGEGVSAAYACKLMADLGADCVKVEAPGGDATRRRGPFANGEEDPERSGLFLYLNTNKRSVVLDLEGGAGRAQLLELVADADILVHNHPPQRMEALGVQYDAFRRARPALVMCSITPFGLTGPYSHYRAEEITLTNAGGWAWLSPGASNESEAPPLKAFGHQADYQAGLAGAMTSLAALVRAQRTGRGEHIDLSEQAYVATILEQALPYYTYSGLVATRLGQRGLNPWGIFACRDGLIFLCTIEADQWDRLVEFMGRPEWTELAIFADFPSRNENADALKIFLGEWIAQWTVDELFHKGQQQRICFAPVLSMEQLAAQEHLHERGFFVDVQHPGAGTLTHLGAPYRLGDGSWQLRRPAPRLGEHDAEVFEKTPSGAAARDVTAPAAASSEVGALPLAGVRVADFSWVWAGPFCAMQLAHLGADVVKLESEGRPDLGRRLPVFVPGLEPGLNRSGYFNQWNQGKRSVRLNLGHPDAVAVAKELIAECDVLVENFATGVMERLGLGYETLRESKPHLVYASISGYGDTGPLRHYMGYGPAIAPLSGLSSLTGYPGGDPREIGISLGDPTSGVTAAVAICAALAARERTGRGQHIDVSLWESMAVLVGEGWMQHAMNGDEPERRGNRDAYMAPHGCFRCAGEEDWVSIACATDAEWTALCGVVDPALARDPRFAWASERKRNEDALDAIVETWTASRDRWEITRQLQSVGVAAFPSLTPKDLAEDPHLHAQGFLAQLEHPEVGSRIHAGIPWRLTEGANGVRTPAPQLGAHTREVLGGWLGYSEEKLDRLTEAKVLF